MPSVDTSQINSESQEERPHAMDRPPRPLVLDPLLRTACTTLLSRVHNVIAALPSQHRVVRTDSRRETDRIYRAKLMEFFQDADWCNTLYDLAGALVKYLVSARTLQQNIPNDRLEDTGQFAISCLEVRLLHPSPPFGGTPIWFGQGCVH